MRRPRDGLHRRRVVAVPQHRVRAVRAPYEQLVIVPPGSELAVVVAPLQAADFGLVPDEFSDVVLARADVALKHVSIAAAARQQRAAPCEAPDARSMPAHRPHFLTLRRVPYLHLALIRPDREVRPSRRPSHRAHRVVRPEVAELRHATRARAPQVHARPQPHGEDVVRGPVHEVEVEVVLQRRRVEHLKRRPRDFPRRLSRRRERVRRRSALERRVAADGGERVGGPDGREREARRRVGLEPEQVARAAVRGSRRAGGGEGGGGGAGTGRQRSAAGKGKDARDARVWSGIWSGRARAKNCSLGRGAARGRRDAPRVRVLPSRLRERDGGPQRGQPRGGRRGVAEHLRPQQRGVRRGRVLRGWGITRRQRGNSIVRRAGGALETRARGRTTRGTNAPLGDARGVDIARVERDERAARRREAKETAASRRGDARGERRSGGDAPRDRTSRATTATARSSRP